jgi:hypothetical protein
MSLWCYVPCPFFSLYHYPFIIIILSYKKDFTDKLEYLQNKIKYGKKLFFIDIFQRWCIKSNVLKIQFYLLGAVFRPHYERLMGLFEAFEIFL